MKRPRGLFCFLKFSFIIALSAVRQNAVTQSFTKEARSSTKNLFEEIMGLRIFKNWTLCLKDLIINLLCISFFI